jgi:Fungal chitosanase of glycosyl hydrolase group 75
MSSITLAVIKGITVVQDDDGRVHWEGGGAVDADGANGQNGKLFSYRKDDTGLDALANAGYPNRSWRDVLIEKDHTGQPTDDGNGNWYSSTTYAWKGRPLETRYVDAAQVPYLVVNPIVRAKAKGVVIGCKARVTYKGKTIDAVVADVSGGKDIGEMSIAAAEMLGIPSSPRHGGVDSGVEFEFWPGQAATVNGELYELQRAGS